MVLVVKLVHMRIVCQNGPSKILILVRQRHLMVRQFYDEGVRHDHECLTHIMDIYAPFPGGRRVHHTIDKCIILQSTVL